MKLVLFVCLFLISLPSFANMKYASYEEFALSTFRQEENTLTIHVIPSSYELEWTKPRWLLWSLLKNEYWFPRTKSTLGHVTGEINCKINGTKVFNFIGQATKDLNGFKAYVHMGYGFSILNRPNMYEDLPLLTTSGILDDYKKSSKRFYKLIGKNNMGFISFKITPEQCQEVNRFMLEYQQKTKETKLAGNRYGFGADPKAFTGAGCAPMVQTLLTKAGIEDYARHMEKTVFVKEELLGDPPKGKKVGILDLFFSGDDISVEKEGARKFVFPDPQGIYDRIQGIVHNKFTERYRVVDKQNLNGKNSWYVLLDTTKTE